MQCSQECNYDECQAVLKSTVILSKKSENLKDMCSLGMCSLIGFFLRMPTSYLVDF